MVVEIVANMAVKEVVVVEAVADSDGEVVVVEGK